MESKYLAMLAIILTISISCKQKPLSDKQKALKVIQSTPSNSKELNKLINYYSLDSKDSLKLKAAYFLIGNMPGKGYYKYTVVDRRGLAVNFYEFCNKRGLNIIKGKKHYEDSTKTKIFFLNPQFKEDVTYISANYLIENIEYSFKAWQLPWAKTLNFSQFKELLLPYRVNKEPLQHWRKQFYDKKEWIFSRLKQSGIHSRFEITSMVNDSLKKKYRYIHDSIAFCPEQLSLKEIELLEGGRCDDLNVLVGYTLRSIGIPIAQEYTDFWANSNMGGHSWLGVLNKNNRFSPMNPLYDNPVLDSLPFKGAHLAKAYRKTYEISDTALLNFVHKKKLPKDGYYDITSSYLPVSNVKIEINFPIRVGQKIWLGVLNGTYWKPLETQSEQTGKQVIFKNIARNVLYAAIIKLPDHTTRTVSTPFFLSEIGAMYKFAPKKNKKTNVSFQISRIRHQLLNKVCEVVYWDNESQEWSHTGSVNTLNDDPIQLIKQKSSKTIEFKSVPKNAIYRIIDNTKNPNGISYGRPFLYNPEYKRFIDY